MEVLYLVALAVVIAVATVTHTYPHDAVDLVERRADAVVVGHLQHLHEVLLVLGGGVETAHADAVVREPDDAVTIDEDGVDGGGGHIVFTLTPTKDGTFTSKFTWKHLQESTEATAKYTITVKDGKIVDEDFMYDGDYELPEMHRIIE